MAIHRMHLQKDPFDRIQSGAKTVEFRLYDSKRAEIKPGDNIIFDEMSSGKQLTVQVDGLHRTASFLELQKILITKGIITEEQFDPSRMRKYYSKEDEDKYGVVGIQIHVVDDRMK